MIFDYANQILESSYFDTLLISSIGIRDETEVMRLQKKEDIAASLANTEPKQISLFYGIIPLTSRCGKPRGTGYLELCDFGLREIIASIIAYANINQYDVIVDFITELSRVGNTKAQDNIIHVTRELLCGAGRDLPLEHMVDIIDQLNPNFWEAVEDLSVKNGQVIFFVLDDAELMETSIKARVDPQKISPFKDREQKYLKHLYRLCKEYTQV